jgi:glycosyltransferase involved in cell wall biosynthesis
MTQDLDLVCFSHLRYNFVFQRPNHLMERCARDRRVFFVEEPVFDGDRPQLSVERVGRNLSVVVPRLPRDTPPAAVPRLVETAVKELFREWSIEAPITWYYTPMALASTSALKTSLVVYDCMDQLSAFHGAPPYLREREIELLQRAQLVFTGGMSLYAEKRRHHSNVHAFPSSVDAAHFRVARERRVDPPDQLPIARPRLGFYGVIDERFDLVLLETLARERPNWQIVLLGPVVKIDPGTLPRLSNIHYLGQKAYRELPDYLAGWDVAIMPFAENEATRFISPTKTLEYFAGGRPVVSTPIHDVVYPYGERGLVEIARRDGFVRAVERALASGFAPVSTEVDTLLSQTSWDQTWARMWSLVEQELADSPTVPAARFQGKSPLSAGQ